MPGGLTPDGYERLRAALRLHGWLESLSDRDLVRFALHADGRDGEMAVDEMMRRLAPEEFGDEDDFLHGDP